MAPVSANPSLAQAHTRAEAAAETQPIVDTWLSTFLNRSLTNQGSSKYNCNSSSNSKEECIASSLQASNVQQHQRHQQQPQPNTAASLFSAFSPSPIIAYLSSLAVSTPTVLCLSSIAAAAPRSAATEAATATASIAAAAAVACDIHQTEVPCTPRYINKGNAFAAGIFSGVAVAGIFNPWDRALYLSVVHARPFFAVSNWRHPYTGFLQVLFHRTLASGMYYPLFDVFRPHIEHAVTHNRLTATSLSESQHSLLVSVLVGNAAGATSGALLNPLTAVKYHAWDTQHSFTSTCRSMWAEGGSRPFTNAIGPTILRDTIFGGAFSCTKHVVSVSWCDAAVDTQRQRQGKEFLGSMAGGALGTLLSAPLNFVRNIQYGTPATQQSASGYIILCQLLADARQQQHPLPLLPGAPAAAAAAAAVAVGQHPLMYIQDRLRIGWGTTRVAVGMAVGYEMYDLMRLTLDGRSQRTAAAAAATSSAEYFVLPSALRSAGGTTAVALQQETQSSMHPKHSHHHKHAHAPASSNSSRSDSSNGNESATSNSNALAIVSKRVS